MARPPGELVATNDAGHAFTCDTLELPWQDNAPGVSCIMNDHYSATIWHSDHLDCDVLRLEDKHGRKDNAPGVSCIMNDHYSATIWHSDHLDCDVLRLEDKHGRKNCLIHCGNFAGNVAQGMETQVTA
ncbi:DUF5675 family protein [Xanthomonas sp. MUS 060]|uniref:DUF5675 family protein n=1 Tax=Xanthomonas sp. MUS 060 TaxID=1588031 RepID=UPI0005F2AC77|nr:DUF5675 family protein [Xanthomonas sp. MUS 060]